jgi:DNA invertase Pin-like site-specific DNA recombinase
VDYWFADEISGKVSASQRPQFRELLGKIRDGERLVVAKLDRLGRDAQDIWATLKLLAQAHLRPVADFASAADPFLDLCHQPSGCS